MPVGTMIVGFVVSNSVNYTRHVALECYREGKRFPNTEVLKKAGEKTLEKFTEGLAVSAVGVALGLMGVPPESCLAARRFKELKDKFAYAKQLPEELRPKIFTRDDARELLHLVKNGFRC